MKIKNLHYIFISLTLISTICLSGCSIEVDPTDKSPKYAISYMYNNITNKVDKDNMAIKDIAFDMHKKYGYTVYIKETSEFVPYLVLTSDYNGNTLLLRKKLLDEPRTFNDEGYGNSGYYKDSDIDKFLTKKFVSTIETNIQNNIVNSEITITSIPSLGATGEDTETINRKIFSLSVTEIGMTDLSIVAEEGKPLQYFKDSKSRIAYNNKEARCWQLRSPETWSSDTVCGIGPNGKLGYGGSESINNVRPAFCIKNTQSIEKSDKVIKGQSVYIIAKDK